MWRVGAALALCVLVPPVVYAVLSVSAAAIAAVVLLGCAVWAARGARGRVTVRVVAAGLELAFEGAVTVLSLDGLSCTHRRSELQNTLVVSPATGGAWILADDGAGGIEQLESLLRSKGVDVRVV